MIEPRARWRHRDRLHADRSSLLCEYDARDRIRSYFNAAVGAAGLWDEFESDWLCLDGELMPWSVKGQEELLRTQYAAVGAAATAALGDATTALASAAEYLPAVEPLLAQFRQRAELVEAYIDAYRQYCWEVTSVADLKLAPFHLLASESAVHIGQGHQWHMETLARLCRADEEVLLATPYRIVDVTDPSSESEATRWWEDHTGSGGEGMVVKPLEFVTRATRARPARGEVPRPGVPAHHLRARVYRAGEPRTVA